MDYSNDDPQPDAPEFCDALVDGESCGVEIKTMAFKGTGKCGEEHRKLAKRQQQKGTA